MISAKQLREEFAKTERMPDDRRALAQKHGLTENWVYQILRGRSAKNEGGPIFRFAARGRASAKTAAVIVSERARRRLREDAKKVVAQAVAKAGAEKKRASDKTNGAARVDTLDDVVVLKRERYEVMKQRLTALEDYARRILGGVRAAEQQITTLLGEG